MFPKFTMRSSTCFGYKHLIFIPYALANVVEDEGDFIVAEGHGHPLRPCVRDGARVCKFGRLGLDQDSQDSENGIRKMADRDSWDSENGIRKNGIRKKRDSENEIRKNGIRKKRDSAFKPIGPGSAKTGSSLSVLCSCNSKATSACMYAPN
jgi:hypothetical protein